MRRITFLLVGLLLQVGTGEAYANESNIEYLEGNIQGVRSLAISQSQRLVASGDDGGKIILWATPTMKKIAEILVGKAIVHSLAFNANETCLYASGTTDRPECGIVEISLGDYTQRTLNVGATGSILLVSPIELDTKLVVVTAANELIVADMKNIRKDKQVTLDRISKRSLFGGFLRQAVLSNDGRFLAVATQNEVDGKSASPQILEIIDLMGNAGMKYTFDSQFSYVSSSCVFSPQSKIVWLYRPQQPMLQFSLDEGKSIWSESLVGKAAPQICSLASCIDPNTGTIYLSGGKNLWQNDTIYSWKPSEGIIRKVVSLKIDNKRKVGPWAVRSLLWIPNPPRLLAAQRDGKIAVIGLAEIQKTTDK